MTHGRILLIFIMILDIKMLTIVPILLFMRTLFYVQPGSEFVLTRDYAGPFLVNMQYFDIIFSSTEN